MALDQGTRLFTFNVAGLGDNELLLLSLNGSEEISRLFSFRIELISDNNGLQPKQVVGKNVSISMTLSDDSQRFFNGFVNRFSAGDEDENGRRNYSAEVVPWMWFLTQTADCRIFQNKTVPQIIEQIFEDLGFSDFETGEIKGEHKQWEYCVQYRETDFNFVSRLMEQEGIFYYFRHEAEKHILVLADQKNAYKDCVEKEVDYPSDFGSRPMEDYITSWEHNYEFHSGKWAHTDFDFKKPSTSLMSQTNTKTSLVNIRNYEIYDYPGEYVERSDGDGEVRLRIEEEEVQHDVVEATSKCKSFTPGGKFKLREHVAKTEEGKKFVITSIRHAATETMAYETGDGSGGDEYSNTFSAIPDSVVFRPARVTPKPLVCGVQTAIVVGPAGEEIYPDEFGRVKVQFHWDREGKQDENSSCWMRVSQAHAGKGFGGIDLPRIGEEVIVDFLEGDPDRPIIIGRVYHAENMPPFGLPDNKNVSGMKSNSSKGGGGYNEISLNDTKGKEKITIHGQYDMNTTVQHDQTTTVHNNRTTKVDVDHTETIGGKQTVTVKGGPASLYVDTGNRVVIVENQYFRLSKSVYEEGTEGIEIKGSSKGITMKGEPKIAAEGTANMDLKSQNVAINGTSTFKVESPDVDVGSAAIKIHGSKIELITDGGSITLDGSGIAITGSKISSTTTGIHEITGSLVKINT